MALGDGKGARSGLCQQTGALRSGRLSRPGHFEAQQRRWLSLAKCGHRARAESRSRADGIFGGSPDASATFSWQCWRDINDRALVASYEISLKVSLSAGTQAFFPMTLIEEPARAVPGYIIS